MHTEAQTRTNIESSCQLINDQSIHCAVIPSMPTFLGMPHELVVIYPIRSLSEAAPLVCGSDQRVGHR